MKCSLWNKNTINQKKEFMKKLRHKAFRNIHVHKTPSGSCGLGFFVQDLLEIFLHDSWCTVKKPTKFHTKMLSLPLDSPFPSASSPTREPRVKGAVKSLLTLPILLPQTRVTLLLLLQPGAKVKKKTKKTPKKPPKNQTLCHTWKHGMNAEGLLHAHTHLRVPGSRGQTLPWAPVHPSPGWDEQQHPVLEWLRAESHITPLFCPQTLLLQTPGNAGNSPAAHTAECPGVSTVSAPDAQHTPRVCRLSNCYLHK